MRPPMEGSGRKGRKEEKSVWDARATATHGVYRTMFFMRRWNGVVMLTLNLSVGALASQTARLPDLPKLAMDNFLPEVRSQLQQADDAARQRPKDAEAAGKLG